MDSGTSLNRLSSNGLSEQKAKKTFPPAPSASLGRPCRARRRRPTSRPDRDRAANPPGLADPRNHATIPPTQRRPAPTAPVTATARPLPARTNLGASEL
ncbi:hypothetical protein HPP92_008200 [Vanilla planifolia]|uniref:Uncharacterized protein n=1 Tax=Vanilla planifolia TaxID=51239 RepID=A0A835RI28_VANPL|nr:hypothetical protein HPP92_008200 [Vanilla planifolia]